VTSTRKFRVLLVPDSIYWVTGTIAKSIATANPWIDATVVSGPLLGELFPDADAISRRFDLVHKQHRIPEDVQDVRVPKSVFRKEQDGMWNVHVPALLEAMGLVSSRSEARRLQAQGGVRMNGQSQPAEDLPIEGDPPGTMAGSVWQVGRRRFARLAGLAD